MNRNYRLIRESDIDNNDKIQIIEDLSLSLTPEEYDILIELLTSALAEEFNAWYQYIIILPFLYGRMRPNVVKFFEDTAKDELEDHAYWLMERLNQLGVNFSELANPSFWNTKAEHKYIYPKYDTISAIENNIKAEIGAIETYTKLERFTRNKDVVTNTKIKDILADEQIHLSELQDLKRDLEEY